MEKLYVQLQDDTQSLWRPHTVRRLERMPTQEEFYREYVSTNTPVIIDGGARCCLAEGAQEGGHPLDLDMLVMRGNVDREVTVNFTPTGKGDIVIDHEGQSVFVKPDERRMSLGDFVQVLHGEKKCGGIPYLSHQNDNLRREFPELAKYVAPSIKLAVDAFGNEPDAVNVWIGDGRSMSSVHKDHYENMYCVVQGQKQFTLLPPSDILFLYEQEYPQGSYKMASDGHSFDIQLDSNENKVSWIPLDPDDVDLDVFPLFRYASPIKCCVGEGDILYLPALWYHQVSQSGLTIAVNYWHDMRFDHKYVYYSFLQQLAKQQAQLLTT